MSRWVVVLVLVGLMATGCGAAPIERPPEPTANPTAAGSVVSIPADGVSLSVLGFSNGPGTSFSVPRVSQVTVGSDQSSVVTVVFASPDASELYGYLVRTLPAAGYEITGRHADPTTPALAFAGHGWSGNFTGNGSRSALTLRPVV